MQLQQICHQRFIVLLKGTLSRHMISEVFFLDIQIMHMRYYQCFGCTIVRLILFTDSQCPPLFKAKQHIFISRSLFAELCSICMSSLDFEAGLASSRSSHVTILNSLTKVIAGSRFNANTLPTRTCLFSPGACHQPVAGFSSLFRVRPISKPVERIV